jgi:hypothetical protein
MSKGAIGHRRNCQFGRISGRVEITHGIHARLCNIYLLVSPSKVKWWYLDRGWASSTEIIIGLARCRGADCRAPRRRTLEGSHGSDRGRAPTLPAPRGHQFIDLILGSSENKEIAIEPQNLKTSLGQPGTAISTLVLADTVCLLSKTHQVNILVRDPKW